MTFMLPFKLNRRQFLFFWIKITSLRDIFERYRAVFEKDNLLLHGRFKAKWGGENKYSENIRKNPVIINTC